MPRRRLVPKRKIMPDPKYKQITVAKFINALMLDGKKAIAEKILYNAFDVIISVAVPESRSKCLKRRYGECSDPR